LRILLLIRGEDAPNMTGNTDDPRHVPHMSTIRGLRRSAVVAALVALAVFPASVAKAIIPRIALNPGAVTLSEGGSAQISATLDEPIVCPDLSLPCQVTLDFSASVPAGISLSSPSIMWSQAEWAQTKSFTVSVSNPSLLANNQVVHLRAVADSRSEYYRAFAVDLVVTLAITPPATTTTVPPATTTVPPATTTEPPAATMIPNPNPSELAETGTDSILLRFAFGFLIVGAALTIRRKILSV